MPSTRTIIARVPPSVSFDHHLGATDQRGRDRNAEGGGCLVTSWLKPGKHHLTVRAIPIVGHPATDAVTGRVLPAPRPPSALAGTWQRKISDTSAALL